MIFIIDENNIIVNVTNGDVVVDPPFYTAPYYPGMWIGDEYKEPKPVEEQLYDLQHEKANQSEIDKLEAAIRKGLSL